MIASIVALIGGVMFVLAVMVMAVKRRKSGERVQWQDSEVLRGELNRWSYLVLQRRKTIRAVKKFENQARFLGASEDVTDEWLPSLVGICALAEEESITESIEEWIEQLQKDNRRLNAIENDLGSGGQVVLKSWMGKTKDEHWNTYRALLGGVTF